MANFDLRTFLTENKLTRVSRTLNENTNSLNDVIAQLQSAIDPANYADMDLGSEEDIIITMLENVQEISRNLLRNLSSPTKQLDKGSEAAIMKIAADIEAYRDEELGDAADAVGDVGLEHLGIGGFGKFNEKMTAELEQALKLYYDGKITVEEAAKKVAAALMNRANYR
jgi:hypothetical protein